jgi:REP element-mobilizing transposase RayT
MLVVEGRWLSDDAPLGFFITWTVYGSFLQGDRRWWTSRGKGSQSPEARLEQWHRERLKHDVILLDGEQRSLVSSECKRLCNYRRWKLWIVNSRTNHVHIVVTAPNYSGANVRNQLKANCTRVLREKYPVFVERPVWTVGGDWKCLNSEDDLEQAIVYAGEVQDRMGRGK